MSPEQLDYLAHHYSREGTNRGKLLSAFPELTHYLFDFTKAMKLIDLSWMKCVSGERYEYSKDSGMWGKEFRITTIYGKAQFEWGGRTFETELFFFKPNKQWNSPLPSPST